MEVFVHLTDEGVEGNVTQLYHLSIEVGNGVLGVVIRLKEQAVERTGEQGFGIEFGAEAEIKAPLFLPPWGGGL